MIKLFLIFKFWKFKIKMKINNSFILKVFFIVFDCVKVCVFNIELWIVFCFERNIYNVLVF